MMAPSVVEYLLLADELTISHTCNILNTGCKCEACSKRARTKLEMQNLWLYLPPSIQEYIGEVLRPRFLLPDDPRCSSVLGDSRCALYAGHLEDVPGESPGQQRHMSKSGTTWAVGDEGQ